VKVADPRLHIKGHRQAKRVRGGFSGGDQPM